MSARRILAQLLPWLLLTAVSAAASGAPASGSAADSYARQVGFAPGYSWNVVAAGYAVCGELARGATPSEIIAQASRYGLAGDLWTSDGVARAVAASPTLCPDPTRTPS